MNIFFFLLYIIVKFLVNIGEFTEQIILIPFKFLFFLLKLIEQLLVRFALIISKIDKRIKTFAGRLEQQLKNKKSFTPLPKHIEVLQKPSSISLLLNAVLKIYRAFSNKLITILESIRSTIQFKKRFKQFIRFFRYIFKLPYLIITAVGNTAIQVLNKISFVRPQLKKGIRFFDTSWFRLFRMSFSSSFKYFILGFLFCLLVIFIQQSYFFVKNLPSPKTIGLVNFQQSTHLYDRNGKLLYEIYRDQNRTPVKLKQLPVYVAQASIAIEDKTFYNHHGIAIVGGILRAMKDTYRTGELQGGSTLTQQLVKSALLTPERTFDRKLKEIFLAIWTERLYSKEQILEMYLNQVPYGGSAYGIEEAAKTYFGKHAKELSIAEAALLAGLPRGPSIYSPYVNPEFALNRRNDVLHRMYELGYITEDQKQTALNTKVVVKPPVTAIRAPHFVFYTKSELEKEYGIQRVEEGGFKVRTTLDLDIQEQAEKILKEELEKVKWLNVTNGGILVTKPKTGEIIAMVGSVDYFAKPYGAFNVTTTLRQPGSSLKPAVYALNLEKGMTAATIYQDTQTVIKVSNTETYKPENYDSKYHGNVTMRMALANSYNIPAVKAVQMVGPAEYANFAKRLGIETWDDPSRYGLSMALGGLEARMVDMAELFGVFANNGYKTPPVSVLSMEDHNGNKMFNYNPSSEKVLDEGIAYIISDILSDNIARVPAFGGGSALEIPGYKVAVKTGTTDYKKDNWTVGYTPEYLVAVWVGNNDNTPMNQALASGITGAAPIWQRTMQYLLQNKVTDPTKLQFVKPDDVVEKPCYNNPREVFLRGTENSVPCVFPQFKPTQKK